MQIYANLTFERQAVATYRADLGAKPRGGPRGSNGEKDNQKAAPKAFQVSQSSERVQNVQRISRARQVFVSELPKSSRRASEQQREMREASARAASDAKVAPRGPWACGEAPRRPQSAPSLRRSYSAPRVPGGVGV